MQFTKSDWKVPPNIVAAKMKGAHHPDAKTRSILHTSTMLDLIRQITSNMAQQQIRQSNNLPKKGNASSASNQAT